MTHPLESPALTTTGNAPTLVAPEHFAPLIIPLLEHQEALLHTLYARYAALSPELRAFWSQLAAEELLHMGWVRRLEQYAARGEVTMHPRRFNMQALRLSINYIIDEIVRAGEQPDLSPLTALTVAVYLEQSVLEKKFFTVFEGTSPEAAALIDEITDCVVVHLKRVQEMWNHYREPIPA